MKIVREVAEDEELRYFLVGPDACSLLQRCRLTSRIGTPTSFNALIGEHNSRHTLKRLAYQRLACGTPFQKVLVRGRRGIAVQML